MPMQRKIAGRIAMGTVMLAVAGVIAWKATSALNNPQPIVAEGEKLRDAVGAPGGAARVALGKPVPVSFFAGPSARRAELEAALLSSRRRRISAEQR